MRFHAIPHTVFFRGASRLTPRISWRIVDVDAGINDRAWPRKCVATANDEATGRRIADMMNGVNSAEHERLQAAWQGCLDRANRNAAEAREAADSLRKLLDAAIGERDAILDGSYSASLKSECDRLRAQLFDAREQRDEARDAVPATDKVEYAPLESPAYQQLREQLIADVHRRLMNASRIISENISLERTRRT